MRHLKIAAPFALATLLAAGCASGPPQTAASLATEIQAVTLATQAADTYVRLAHPDAATLVHLKTLNDAVHAALVAAEADQAAGRPLTLAALDAALAALSAYLAAHGAQQ